MNSELVTLVGEKIKVETEVQQILTLLNDEEQMDMADSITQGCTVILTIICC